jgi:hypothetical protein
MENKIQISGLYKDGWNLFVPVTLTPRFMAYLRHKICFMVDVAAISGGLEPEVDIFILSDRAFDENGIKTLIQNFEAIQ